MKKLLSIAIPAAVIAFVLFAVGGKMIQGLITPEDPMIAAKTKEVKPVLQKLKDDNLKRFENYRKQQFKGVPFVTLYDSSQLTIDYTVESPANAKEQREDAHEQFHRLLCRDIRFTDLYKVQTRLLEETGKKLPISITVSSYESEERKLLWRIAVTPESCIKRSK